VNASCFDVCGVSFFWGFELPKKLGFSFKPDERCKFSVLSWGRAKKPCGGVGVWLCPVLRVCLMANVTKIRNPVVSRIAVDVVNEKLWPLTVEDQPGETMSKICLLPYRVPDVRVSRRIVARRAVGSSLVWPANNLPFNYSGVRAVAKALARLLSCKIFSSHEALLMLIGQRLPAISSRSGASLFYQRKST